MGSLPLFFCYVLPVLGLFAAHRLPSLLSSFFSLFSVAQAYVIHTYACNWLRYIAYRITNVDTYYVWARATKTIRGITGYSLNDFTIVNKTPRRHVADGAGAMKTFPFCTGTGARDARSLIVRRVVVTTRESVARKGRIKRTIDRPFSRLSHGYLGSAFELFIPGESFLSRARDIFIFGPYLPLCVPSSRGTCKRHDDGNEIVMLISALLR